MFEFAVSTGALAEGQQQKCLKLLLIKSFLIIFPLSFECHYFRPSNIVLSFVYTVHRAKAKHF